MRSIGTARKEICFSQSSFMDITENGFLADLLGCQVAVAPIGDYEPLLCGILKDF
jgi:hypothetical protein